MVGSVFAALGVAASIHLGGAGEGRPLDEIGKLSQAIALTRACPYLTLDRAQVAATLARAGIRVGPVMPEIVRRSQTMALNYAHLDRKEACAVARGLYGAAGTSAPGFLAER